MINKIYSSIEMLECNGGHDLATKILAIVEELGMRPPLYTEKDPGHFPGDQFHYLNTAWEDEDEA